MNITLQEFARLTEGIATIGANTTIERVTVHSGHVAPGTLFFALPGARTDGHAYVTDALARGAVAAVVSRAHAADLNGHGPLILVDDPLRALQRLAGWWRTQLQGKVIAITGSNGKTIVKDALLQALSAKYTCAGSPGSYNSQLGVPLALLQIPREVDYAVIEVGVSEPGEMAPLAQIVRPDYGILTNIGMAHIAAFGSREAIAREKFLLFTGLPGTSWLLVSDALSAEYLEQQPLQCPVLQFGKNPAAGLPVQEQLSYNSGGSTNLCLAYEDGAYLSIDLDTASTEIAIDVEAALCAAHLLGVPPHLLETAFKNYQPAATQMEIWRSPTGITFINDAYSSDPISVRVALRMLSDMKRFDPARQHIFVFGGMRELGEKSTEEHAAVGRLAAEHGVDALILEKSGPLESTARAYLKERPDGKVLWVEKTGEIVRTVHSLARAGDTVLFKGPRNAGIDQAARESLEVIAPNRLWIDMGKVAENIARIRRAANPATKLLAMVKGLAYGTNLVQMAKELQKLPIWGLGVSTPDEGILLREAGVTLPIIVMLCTREEVEKIVKHRLTPVIYSLDLVEPLYWTAHQAGTPLDVHLKVDSGMGRLGVLPSQLEQLLDQVQKFSGREVMPSGNHGFTGLQITGLMTHFASADDPAQDDFTHGQIAVFKDAIALLKERTGNQEIIIHAANTAAAARFPEARFDMVRIGLGLYGVYPSPAVAEAIELELAVSLVSRLTEIRTLPKGHRISYNGTFTVPHDNFKAGIVPMGYYDGIPVSLSNRGHVLIHGQRAPIVGRVSMDSLTIDVSHIPNIRPGAEVLFYGHHAGHERRPEDLAQEAGTIPYELLTRLGTRVQRIFKKS